MNIVPDDNNKTEYQGVTITRPAHAEQFGNNMKALFINELLANIDRFPEDNLSLLSALNICLNPKGVKAIPPQDVPNYGVQELEKILGHFECLPDNHFVQPARARLDFLAFKNHLRQSSAASLEAAAEELAKLFADVYPDFNTLIAFFQAISMKSVPVKEESANRTC